MRGLRVVILISILIFASGCVTTRPVDSKRSGLFDSPENSSRLETPAAVFPSRAQRKMDHAHSQARAHSGDPELWDSKNENGDFKWPVRFVRVTSTFGKRGREFHEGLDLKAAQGTPVFAAREGRVLYADSKIKGYGKLIVLRHERNIATVYAHNSKLLVRKGQFVKQGQQVALSGATGHVYGPHVHFEVRKGLTALDPQAVLPSKPRRALASLGRPAPARLIP